MTGSVSLAKKWIQDAEYVLITAGAGMSAYDKSQRMNVYVDPDDFAHHYPDMVPRGYNTCYECMGLLGDPSVPYHVKWGFWARHIRNMRFVFPANEGYEILKRIVRGKDAFVWTSNVDGCFVRAGFEQVYTPQGDYGYYQCVRKCSPNSVWPSGPLVESLLPHILPDGSLPEALAPKCPVCQGPVFGNVRGGNWFLHTPHLESQQKIRAWVQRILTEGKRLTILEIGAGFNTPVITRFPMEALTAEGTGVRLVRINPTECEVPSILQNAGKAIGISRGWDVLREIETAEPSATEPPLARTGTPKVSCSQYLDNMM
eukprot:PhF_6_TR11304/c0_g1_i1/m.18247